MPAPNGNGLSAQERQTLRDLKYEMWGVSGKNGVAGRVRTIDHKLTNYIAEEERRRKEESENAQESDLLKRLAYIGIIGAALSPVIGWALFTLSGG